MIMILPFLIFLLAIVLGRRINDRSYKLLTEEEKVKLVDILSKNRIFGYAFSAIIIVLILLFFKFNFVNRAYVLVVFVACYLVYLSSTSFITYKKLKENNYSDKFSKLYILSMLVRFLGFVLFFIAFFWASKSFK